MNMEDKDEGFKVEIKLGNRKIKKLERVLMNEERTNRRRKNRMSGSIVRDQGNKNRSWQQR